MASNLEYYRAFYYAATYSSVTKAANALFLTQSAISQSIKKLEQECGCALFARGSRGISLTHEGEVLFHHVQQAFQLFDQGEHLVAQLANYESGELRIGATETAFYRALIPHLAEFRQQYPKVRFQITGCTTPELCEALQDSSIDIALLVSPIPDNFPFQCIPLTEIQDIFVAGAAFAHLKDREVSLDELEQYPLVRVDTQSSAGKYLDQWMLQYNRTLEPDFRVRTSSLILPLVESGLAIGILPDLFFHRYPKDRGLFRLQIHEQIPARTLCLATNTNRPVSMLCQTFMQSMEAMFTKA